MKLQIRRMRKEDIPGVLQVERACFSEPWSAETFSATLLLPYAYYYVAEMLPDAGGEMREETPRIVGQCGVRDILGEGEITNVSVLPGFRGRGISRRLLGMLLREAGERGTRVFTLEVRAGNRPAIALYESLGFRTEGVRRGFYEKPAEDALIMWKR